MMKKHKKIVSFLVFYFILYFISYSFFYNESITSLLGTKL